MTVIGHARAKVLHRDGGCVAPRLDRDAGECGDQWGRPLVPGSDAGLEVDRIRDHPTMGKAPGHDDPSRMVTLCARHHRGMGRTGGRLWATANRDRLRAYLAEVNGGNP